MNMCLMLVKWFLRLLNEFSILLQHLHLIFTLLNNLSVLFLLLLLLLLLLMLLLFSLNKFKLIRLKFLFDLNSCNKCIQIWFLLWLFFESKLLITNFKSSSNDKQFFFSLLFLLLLSDSNLFASWFNLKWWDWISFKLFDSNDWQIEHWISLKTLSNLLLKLLLLLILLLFLSVLARLYSGGIASRFVCFEQFLFKFIDIDTLSWWMMMLIIIILKTNIISLA